MKKCVFLDRDGVINRDLGYVSSISQIQINKNVGKSIRLLNEHGFIVIVVTNQSGVARGYFDESTVWEINQHIMEILAEEGAYIQEFYVCPHLIQGIVKKYAVACDCRKPNPGMLLAAKQKYDIDMAHSYLIGDKSTDIQAGIEAGLKQSFLIETDGSMLQVVEKILSMEDLIEK